MIPGTDQRHALAMLATAGRNRATQALLSAHGFDASMIAELVNHGLATLTAEKVRGRRQADRGRQGADNGGGAGGARRVIRDL